jgi:hypothetical protein
MRYFPPEIQDGSNSEDPKVSRRTARQFGQNWKRYAKQLEALESRFSPPPGWRFITQVITHDATLLSLETGDYVTGPVPTTPQICRRCRAKVVVRLAEYYDQIVYQITYSSIKEFWLDFRKAPDWRSPYRTNSATGWMMSGRQPARITSATSCSSATGLCTASPFER